jgi:DNA-binding NarL/FixJ family response regulator
MHANALAQTYSRRSKKELEMEMRLSINTRQSFRKVSQRRRAAVGKPHLAKRTALTRREREVLAGLAAGKMYKEISDELSVTLDTIRFHSKRIYKKLGVRSRSEAILWLVREGTLESSKTTQRCR